MTQNLSEQILKAILMVSNTIYDSEKDSWRERTNIQRHSGWDMDISKNNPTEKGAKARTSNVHTRRAHAIPSGNRDRRSDVNKQYRQEVRATALTYTGQGCQWAVLFSLVFATFFNCYNEPITFII